MAHSASSFFATRSADELKSLLMRDDGEGQLAQTSPRLQKAAFSRQVRRAIP